MKSAICRTSQVNLSYQEGLEAVMCRHWLNTTNSIKIINTGEHFGDTKRVAMLTSSYSGCEDRSLARSPSL